MAKLVCKGSKNTIASGVDHFGPNRGKTVRGTRKYLLTALSGLHEVTLNTNLSNSKFNLIETDL